MHLRARSFGPGLSSADKSKADELHMTRIPAKVVSVDKRSRQYCVIVRMHRIRYKGSFDTLAFGENKPALGSSHDGRLHLIYFRDPALKEGEGFPLWTIQ
jgi:hypothetical protein